MPLADPERQAHRREYCPLQILMVLLGGLVDSADRIKVNPGADACSPGGEGGMGFPLLHVCVRGWELGAGVPAVAAVIAGIVSLGGVLHGSCTLPAPSCLGWQGSSGLNPLPSLHHHPRPLPNSMPKPRRDG